MQDNKVNYIIHLNTVMKFFNLDDRLNVNHIGFYMLLFQKWNSCGFRNPISIYKDDLMTLGQIGSRNTYLKLLKHLTVCGYIIYIPSQNPNMPSRVYLFKFCTSLTQVVSTYTNYIKYLNNNYNKGKTWIEEYQNSNKYGSSITSTCSNFEQVLNKSQAKLFSPVLSHKTKRRPRYASKPNLHPTGHQPTPDADYSEPL